MPAHKPPALRPSNRFSLTLLGRIFMTVIRETLSTVLAERVVCTTNVLCSFSTCELFWQIVLYLTSSPGARRFTIYSATIYTFVHARLTGLYNRVHPLSKINRKSPIACYRPSLPLPETFRFLCNLTVLWRVLCSEHSSLKCFCETVENVRDGIWTMHMARLWDGWWME